MARRIHPGHVDSLLHRLHSAGRNAVARLPGERPRRLVVELHGSYPPRTKRPAWLGLPLPQELGLTETSFEELDRTIDSLALAPWLDGVLFRFQGLRVDFATAFALRQALGRLRGAGKRVSCWLAELEPRDYYVASAADTVIVPPSADVRLLGFGASVTFLRDALERWGLGFEKLARGKYKDAFDNFVRSEMSPAAREQLEALLDSVEQRFVADVAASRRITPEALRTAMNEGMLSAERARTLGLVDEVKYEDEVVGADDRRLDAAERWLTVPTVAVQAPRIGVVTLQGLIVTGTSRRVPFGASSMGHATAGAESLARALRTVRADPTTGAVVLYVSSGGGSALASDLLWREVRQLDACKPVVAVLGPVAASGGYYVASAARKIVAAPATITGSIGVVTAKLVMERLYERLGIHVERVQRGRFALWYDPSARLSEDARAMLERHVDDSYDRFVARVAEGRGLEPDRVDELGRGRIWSGQQALENGLVDAVGDLRTGIELAARLAGAALPVHAWNVRAPAELVLPNADDPTTLARTLGTLARESCLALVPTLVSLD